MPLNSCWKRPETTPAGIIRQMPRGAASAAPGGACVARGVFGFWTVQSTAVSRSYQLLRPGESCAWRKWSTRPQMDFGVAESRQFLLLM